MRFIIAYVNTLTGLEGCLPDRMTKQEAKDFCMALHRKYLGMVYWFEKD